MSSDKLTTEVELHEQQLKPEEKQGKETLSSTTSSGSQYEEKSLISKQQTSINFDDDHSLSQTVDELVYKLHEQRTRKKFEENPPWKFKFRWKLITDIGVPLLIIILLIAGSASRKKRDKFGTICEISSFINSDKLENVTDINIILTNTSTYTQNCYTIHNDGLSEYEPITEGWRITLSLIPFICVFQGVLGYDLSSRYVAPFTLIITILLGIGYFEGEGWWINPDDTNSNAIFVFGLVAVQIVDRIMWTIFEYAFNVFTAFFFLRVLEMWGIVDQMRIEFEKMCATDNRKVLLILFSFAVMIAVVAPGGSNFLIAGAIMVDINHRMRQEGVERDDYDKRIGAICLFGNGLTSAFNLVGVCIVAISGDLVPLADEIGDKTCNTSKFKNIERAEECAGKQIGGAFSQMFFILGVLSPFIMAGLYDRETSLIKKVKNLWVDVVPLTLCGITYSSIQLLTSLFIGPELVCLLSAGCSLLVYYMYVQCTRHGYRMNGLPNIKSRIFMLPFILLVLVLCCIRLIPGVENILLGGNNGTAESIFNPEVLNISYLTFSFERNFGWLAHSGTTVLFISIITPFIVPYYETKKEELKENQICGDIKDNYNKKNKRQINKLKRFLTKKKLDLKVLDECKINLNEKRKYVLIEAFKKSILEALPVMLSIGSYASIAKLMSKFNMTQSIALGIVKSLKNAPEIFTAFIPIIGMLGSGLTGSTTTSNFLFGQLQVQTAVDLKLAGPGNGNSMWRIAGDQILGASAGEIVAPLNAVFSTLLLGGKFPESDLIKIVFKVFILWLLICIILSILFIVPST